jgi:hypothetical protein
VRELHGRAHASDLRTRVAATGDRAHKQERRLRRRCASGHGRAAGVEERPGRSSRAAMAGGRTREREPLQLAAGHVSHEQERRRVSCRRRGEGLVGAPTRPCLGAGLVGASARGAAGAGAGGEAQAATGHGCQRREGLRRSSRLAMARGRAGEHERLQRARHGSQRRRSPRHGINRSRTMAIMAAGASPLERSGLKELARDGRRI